MDDRSIAWYINMTGLIAEVSIGVVAKDKKVLAIRLDQRAEEEEQHEPATAEFLRAAAKFVRAEA
jgi:hypothetical protein